MKYQFKKNGADDYSLIYGENEIRFNSNVGIVEEIQNIIPEARMQMLTDLSKRGISIKDLTIIEKKDGKTYYDDSNRVAMEDMYIKQEQEKVFARIIKDILGKSYEELIIELGLITREEIQNFSDIFARCILGEYNESPSDDKTEENSKEQ